MAALLVGPPLTAGEEAEEGVDDGGVVAEGGGSAGRLSGLYRAPARLAWKLFQPVGRSVTSKAWMPAEVVAVPRALETRRALMLAAAWLSG